MFSWKTAIILFLFLVISYLVVTYTACCFGKFWLDIPLHFLGGVFSALVFYLLSKKYLKNKSAVFIVTIFLSGASLIGVFWEFFEWLLDYYNPGLLKHQPSLNDTMADLALDLLGGFILSLLFFFRKSKMKANEN